MIPTINSSTNPLLTFHRDRKCEIIFDPIGSWGKLALFLRGFLVEKRDQAVCSLEIG